MIGKTGLALSALAFCLFVSLNVSAATYQHSLNAGKMTFSWSVDSDQLSAKVSAPTTGWVAVGFNPSSKMKDANIIIGYVKKGKVTISDDFGIAATQHKSDTKVGGQNNVTVVGGSEEGNTTVIEFAIPLNSGDQKDGALDLNGDTVVILAYGEGRDSFRVKHSFAETLTVNLGSGAVK